MKYKIFKVGILKTNCILLWNEDSKDGLIVDPGAYDKLLFEFIKKEDIIISTLLITHGHFDHVGGVSKMVEELTKKGMKPLVAMHSLEKQKMESQSPKKYHAKFFDLDIDLYGKAVFENNWIRFELILLPGHTNYSVCFYCLEEGFIIVGDTLMYHSIGTERYYDGPAIDLSNNIVSKLFTLPEETLVIPGHKDSTSIGEEIARNPYLSDADTIDPWIQ